MLILGIETSCDDTGVALYDTEQGLLGHQLHSQTRSHQPYGGVVPELASRDHIRHITALLNNVYRQTGVEHDDLGGVAYTAGPGLAGALMVGAGVAKTMAWSLNIPAIAVHHMEGHLLAPMLEKETPTFPFLALLVSGGHTLLVHAQSLGHYQLLGQTLDDAAGEAFDKTAKLLNLPYPGGPALSALARQGATGRFRFPRPMTDRPGLDFSFSGLKTHAMNTWRNHPHNAETAADIALAFEEAVAETLFIKCRRALEQTDSKQLVVAGGVSANSRIREKLTILAENRQVQLFTPRIDFCTDNAAMIAYAGAQRLLAGQSDDSIAIQISPRWPLSDLTPP